MIKATVKYDKITLQNFMRYNAINSPLKWILYIFIFIVALFDLIISIGTDAQVSSILLMIAVILVDGVALFTYFVLPALKLKKLSDDDIITNDFCFNDEKLEIKSESKKDTDNNSFSYSEFYKIRESKTAFYLYIDKFSALIITKNGITEGNSNSLRDFLNSKITDKKVNKLNK